MLMKKMLVAVAAMAALMSMSACDDSYEGSGGGDGGSGFGYMPGSKGGIGYEISPGIGINPSNGQIGPMIGF